jgi:hypothetical protein
LSCLQLSHNRKTLLKFLLRTIALSSYAPTGNLAATRPQDEDAQLLHASLKVRTHLCMLHDAAPGQGIEPQMQAQQLAAGVSNPRDVSNMCAVIADAMLSCSLL